MRTATWGCFGGTGTTLSRHCTGLSSVTLQCMPFLALRMGLYLDIGLLQV